MEGSVLSFLEAEQKQELPVVAMFVTRSGQYEQYL
jgi:hypothetical protein